MDGVVLVNPQDNTDIKRILGVKTPPLGLMYLASYLEAQSIEVEIIDANLDNASYQQLKRRISQLSPRVVGVTTTTPTLDSALEVVRAARSASPASVTVMGGPHVTFLPERTLSDCPELDLVCIGEGEETLLKTYQALEGFSWGSDGGERTLEGMKDFCQSISGIRGIAYRDPGQNEVVITDPRPPVEDLDSLPFPSRDLVDFSRYSVDD